MKITRLPALLRFRIIRRALFFFPAYKVVYAGLSFISTRFFGKSMKHPIFVQLEPTNRCNLSCSYCPRRFLSLAERDITFEEFKKVVDSNPFVLSTNIQGLGEPLLHKDLFRMINYASSKKIFTLTCTNALLLNDKILKQIAESKLNYLALSVDSLDSKGYQLRKHKESFLNVLKKLTELRERKDDFFIGFWITLSKSNFNELDKIVDIALKHRIDHVAVNLLTSIGFKENSFVRKNKIRDFSAYKKKMRSISELLYEHRILFGCNSPDVRQREFCPWPFTSVYVDAQGNVTPCCRVFDKSILRMNMLTGAFNYKSKEYLNIRTAFRQKKDIAFCRNCYYSQCYNIFDVIR